VTIPTYIKPILSFANIKTGTQVAMCGVNTKIGTSKTYSVSDKKSCLEYWWYG